MPGRFTPLTPLRGWRRVAAHAWRPPQDPSVYALVDVRMHTALQYLDRLRERTGVHVTVSHLVAKGIALAIHQHPQLNGIVARGRVMLRDTVDVFFQVATEGGSDLSGIKIEHYNTGSISRAFLDGEQISNGQAKNLTSGM